MLDRPAVAEIAEAMGFHRSARWVREHRDLYARAIFHGFEVEARGAARLMRPETGWVDGPGDEG